MKKRKELTGKVVSNKMSQTVIVEVEHLTRHPLYRKTVKSTRNFAAHVESGEYAVGDTVKIAESKPISKTKHFVVIGKVSK